MAGETSDYPAVLKFLRESIEAAARGPTPAVPAASDCAPSGDGPFLALDPALEVSIARRTEPGQPLLGCRLLVAGWPEMEGLMLLKPSSAAPAELSVSLAARSERSLRDLCRAFPPGVVGRFFPQTDWMRFALSEFFELQAEPFPALSSPAGPRHSWLGIKRGTAVTLPSPAAGSERRARSGARPDGNALGEIGSGKDPLLPELRALAQPSGRRAQSRFLIEGERLVHRAILDGLPVEQCVFTPELERAPGGAPLLRDARERRIRTSRATAGLMGKITTTRPVPPAIAAVFACFRDAAAFRTHPGTTLLVAEAVNNPENLGMVLRTADAAGIDGVVVLGERSDPYHKLCVRAARGAVGRVPIFACDAPLAFLHRLRAEGFRIMGATAHADGSLYDTRREPPLAVVVGNEQDGITPALLAACTERVRIPMAPGQSSLNVGVAAGVLLYELLRQRLAPR